MPQNLPFKPLIKAHLYQEVADKIKQAIFLGQLKPGDRLPSEQELGRIFGVGRPTVREALRRLEILGLIEINTGKKGSTVKEPDMTHYIVAMKEQLGWLIRVREETIPDFWEVHNFIELGIAQAASRKATQEDFDELDRLIEKMEGCGDDIHTYFPVAREFHEKLALATKNRVFYLVWDIFNDLMVKGYTPILNKLFPEGPSKLIAVNKKVVKAVKSRDRAGIDRAMEIHAEQEKHFPRTHAAVKGEKTGKGYKP
jgi:GntR family transcriptional repressor for pyruvate dehydrogenase complex